jgi:hypothetical protein
MLAPGRGQEAPSPLQHFVKRSKNRLLFRKRHDTVFDKKNGASRPLGRRRNDFYQKKKQKSSSIPKTVSLQYFS